MEIESKGKKNVQGKKDHWGLFMRGGGEVYFFPV